jgi:hypothetical protein
MEGGLVTTSHEFYGVGSLPHTHWPGRMQCHVVLFPPPQLDQTRLANGRLVQHGEMKRGIGLSLR